MKRGLLVFGLSILFTLSLTGAAFAANTTGAGTTTPSAINYPDDYNVQGNTLQNAQNLWATTDADYDNGFINANKTGVGTGGQTAIGTQAIKNVTGQRTHGEYQNNTNSCASCHQVHTAAGEALLMKDGVYETCTACHDGTLGVLNVFAPSTAGTFGGTGAGHASMHLPTGILETKAAPGGNHTDSTVGASWTEDFNCASCHAPHGSYSDRLLNYNPNGIGSSDMYFRASNGTYTDKDGNPSATPVKTGGMKVVGAQVVTALPAANANSADFVVYKTISDDASLDVKVTQENSGTPVIVLMKKASSTSGGVTTYSYKRDINPWIGNVYNFRGTSPLTEDTNFYTAYTYGVDNSANNVKFSATGGSSDKIIVKFAQGYVKNGPATGLDSVQYADISRATVVKFDFLSTDEANFNGLPVKQVDIASYAKSGYGVQIAAFCASCHTDYFNPAGSETGTWSKAFRHNTTSDTYTCLKCHFAHGTDVSVMLDAKDQNLAMVQASYQAEGRTKTDAYNAAVAYLLDNNASSALKRYTNMSVCWKCHTSSASESLTNNMWYSGAVNAGVKASTEFSTAAPNRPAGWVDPDQSTLPYYPTYTPPTP